MKVLFKERTYLTLSEPAFLLKELTAEVFKFDASDQLQEIFLSRLLSWA
jgi:hypothetical protein